MTTYTLEDLCTTYRKIYNFNSTLSISGSVVNDKYNYDYTTKRFTTNQDIGFIADIIECYEDGLYLYGKIHYKVDFSKGSSGRTLIVSRVITKEDLICKSHTDITITFLKRHPHTSVRLDNGTLVSSDEYIKIHKELK